MLKSLRDTRQEEFAQIALNNQLFGILYLCPRFGKIFTCINILVQMSNPRVLICYPDTKIKKSWQDDFKKRQYDDSNVEYTTYLSLGKHLEEFYDLIIFDEIHLMSDAQIENAKIIMENHQLVIGLTGTMTSWTEKNLYDQLGLPVIAHYPIEQGIEEGVISDYEIEVRIVPLDNKVEIKGKVGKKPKTEKKSFDGYSWVIDKLEREARKENKYVNTFPLRLARMRIIQNSRAKMEATRKLLALYKKERVLVFCGLTKIADQLGCPVYHSKAGELEKFENFSNGEGDPHLAVIKIGNTGVTYKPLNRVIINYFDSNGENLAQKINRCMAMEYDNPDKKSKIIIVSTNEPVELKWLDSALEFFDKSKIKYVNI